MHAALRRRLCLLSALVLTVSAAACRHSGKTGNTSSRQPENGPLTPYPVLTEIRQARIINEKVSFVGEETDANNFVTKFYKEKLNLRWVNEWGDTQPNYSIKIEALIASDDLPDVFQANDKQLNMLKRRGLAENLASVFEGYATEKLQENLSLEADTGKELYGIPLPVSLETETPIMYLRDDWLEETGLSAPKSYGELLTVIKAFGEKTAKLTKTNAALMFPSIPSMAFEAVAHTSGAYYDCWIPQNGSIVYSNFLPQMKNALSKMRTMYQEKLIDDNFSILHADRISQLIAEGQYGVVFGPFYYPHILKEAVLKNPRARWGAYPVPQADDGTLRPYLGGGEVQYVVVRRGAEHPEAVIKSMNLWMEIWSESGLYRDWFIEKMQTTHKDVYLSGDYARPFFFDILDNNIEIGKDIREAFATGNPAAAILTKSKSAQFSYSFMADETASNFISGEGWALKHVYLGSERVFAEDYRSFQKDAYGGILPDYLLDTKSMLDNMVMMGFMRIIMGEPLDLFEDLKRQWKISGGDSLTREVNDWYTEHRSESS